MSIGLYPHNQTAYENAVRMMREQGRAAVIHPTGTGKSFIAFRLAEDNPEARICWLAPSEYIFKSQRDAFLKAGGKERSLKNVIFLTYARLLRNEDDLGGLLDGCCVSEGQAGNVGAEEAPCGIGPDYVILDEFHRCGASEWGRGVEKLLKAWPEAKVLGLSATNIRYLDNRRDMAQELFDGRVASRMGLGEAVAAGILPAPVYVTAFYSYEEELVKIEAGVAGQKNDGLRKINEELLEKLRRSLQDARGPEHIFARHLKRAGKYIVFCADHDHMEGMLEKAGEWFGGLDKEPHIYQAYYENNGSLQAFRDFAGDESGHLKLLYCIDMLNEGIHVSGVDGVILLRPTMSPTIYLQQIGRALSAVKKCRERHLEECCGEVSHKVRNAASLHEKDGSGTKPVVLDMVNNFDSLCCVDSLREEMEKAFWESTGGAAKDVREHFQVIDEVQDIRRLFEQLRRNLTAGWEICFREAERYRMEYGNLRVPKRYVTGDGIALGNWIVTQRRVRAKTVAGNLTEDQIRRLDGLGMIWENRSEDSWERGYRELLAYRELCGSADVPGRYVTKEGYPLGRWVSRQRMKRNGTMKGNLTGEQIRRLDAAGFVWGKRDLEWERYYKAARTFYDREGHLDVPVRYCTEEGLRLGSWIHARRFEREVLPPEKAQALDAVGMIWEGSYDRRFEEKYCLAKRFYQENGHLNIPVKYTVEGVKLGRWISTLRSVRSCPDTSNYCLTEERIERLDAIGMIWKQDSWEDRYQLAKAYYREHGNLRIPQTYVAEGKIWLGKWLAQQRKQYQQNGGRKTLSEERARKLEAIGIISRN